MLKGHCFSKVEILRLLGHYLRLVCKLKYEAQVLEIRPTFCCKSNNQYGFKIFLYL